MEEIEIGGFTSLFHAAEYSSTSCKHYPKASSNCSNNYADTKPFIDGTRWWRSMLWTEAHGQCSVSGYRHGGCFQRNYISWRTRSIYSICSCGHLDIECWKVSRIRVYAYWYQAWITCGSVRICCQVSDICSSGISLGQISFTRVRCDYVAVENYGKEDNIIIEAIKIIRNSLFISGRSQGSNNKYHWCDKLHYCISTTYNVNNKGSGWY